MKQNPLISIITVSFNALSTIENTVNSIINQNYSNIEYIIIDGGSTDGTIDIIKKYAQNITYWISEPDKGIYDAMNKAIKLAKGEWINFMNCGDSFYCEDTIEQVIEYISKNRNVDIIYGNVIINSNIGKYMILPENLRNISIHLPFCHQSTFVKTSIAQKYLFDLQYKFVADYNFFYCIYKKGYTFLYINIPIANYQTGEGFTSNHMYQCILEEYKVGNRFFSKTTNWKYKIKFFLIKNLPQIIVNKLRYLQYKNNSRFIKL